MRLECGSGTAINNGPVHAEFRVNEQWPWVLEIAAAADWRVVLAGVAICAGSRVSGSKNCCCVHALGMAGGMRSAN